MAKKETNMFSYAFEWLFKHTRSESQNRLWGDLRFGALKSPLTKQEEMKRRNMARGYKMQSAKKTRSYKKRKNYTKSQLRQKYLREISSIGLGKKRGDFINNPDQATVYSEMERRKRRKSKK
jgi:hypothetical protein